MPTTAIDEERYAELKKEFPHLFISFFNSAGGLNDYGKIAQELLCYRKPELIKSETKKGNIPVLN